MRRDDRSPGLLDEAGKRGRTSPGMMVGVKDLGVVLLMVAVIPLWLLLGTAAARDAGGRGRQGRWVGVAWVLCWPVGVLLWMDSRRYEREA